MTLMINQGLIFFSLLLFLLFLVGLFLSRPSIITHTPFLALSTLCIFILEVFSLCFSAPVYLGPIGNCQGPGRWGCSSPGFFHSVLSEAFVSRQKTNLKSHVNPLLWLWLASVYSHIWEYFYLPQSCAGFSVWFCPNVWECVQISPFVYIGKWCLLVHVFLCTYRYAHYSPFMMLGFRYFVFFTRGLTDHLNLCSVLLLSVYENTWHCII